MDPQGAVTAEPTTTGAEGTAPEGGAAEQSGLDFGPLESRLDQMQGQFEERFEALPQQLMQMQQPEPEPAYDPLADFFGGQSEYDGAEPMELDPDEFQAAIDQQVQARVEAAIGPVQGQLTEMMEAQQAREIEQQYPELRDPQVAQAAVQELAQRGASPDQMSPAMVAMAHEALLGRQLKAQITPAGDGASDGLEATGGGQPGTQQSALEAQQGAVNQIVGARRGSLWD